MKQKPSHTLIGMAFIAVCLIIAGGLYAIIRTPLEVRAQQSTDAMNNELMAAADALDSANAPQANVNPSPEAQIAPNSQPAPNIDSDAPPAWTRHPLFSSFRPRNFPPDLFDGKTVLPDFRGGQKEYADYRTRLREAAIAGPNFAGRYHVEGIGCGTYCSFDLVVDLATGAIADFNPHGGGEDAPPRAIWFQKDTSLVLDYYRDGPDGPAARCVYTVYRFAGMKLEQLARDSGPAPEDSQDGCPG